MTKPTSTGSRAQGAGAVPSRIRLDTRELEHPRPFELAVAAIRQLGTDEYLHMLHRRNPIPLLELAVKHGLQCRSEEDESGVWHILICRDPHLDLANLRHVESAPP